MDAVVAREFEQDVSIVEEHAFGGTVRRMWLVRVEFAKTMLAKR